MTRQAGVVLGMLFLANGAAAQYIQQGSKLVGTVPAGSAEQGSSVAISGDGNTAIVGGPYDNSYAGAAWVYTRSGGVWSQQGNKLVGTGAVGDATQGASVAISADGNTAAVGGPGDNFPAGAAWVYTRSGGVWSQQGSKLVGTGADGPAFQGGSVAISADGSTVIVGGKGDNSWAGAAWVYTRSGGVWSQQDSKLVGAGAVGPSFQGTSVAISADGNTGVLGGPWDDSQVGAAWVFTRSGGVWSQQGSKLVGTGGVGASQEGYSVAISADGSTAVVGGNLDNYSGGQWVGAAWVFTRSEGVWSQQGNRLVGTGVVGGAQQGWSVAISGDGSTATVGGPLDNSSVGAAWVYTRSAGLWSQQGGKLVGTGAVGGATQGNSVAISADGTTVIVGGPTDDSDVGAAWVFVSSATQLAFVQQPTTTAAGQPITPAVTVQLEDSGGTPVAQGGVTVTMWLSSGTGTLGGTLSQVTDASGFATFNDLSIDLVGSKQLTAANPGRTSAVSSPFTITAGAATSIVATGGTTQSALINAQFAQPLEVALTDAFTNPVAGALVTYSAPSSGPSASLSNGGSATTDANGHASVTAVANGVAGGPYLVTAATGTLPPVTFSLTNLQPIPMLGGFGLLGLALLLLAAGAVVLRKF